MSSPLSAVVALPPMQTLTRVLVISDDRSAQKALQRILESDGYIVAVAGSTVAGLEALRTNPPMALVLDLPRKSNAPGRQMFQKIRQTDHRVPVVVLGLLSEADTVELLELGVDDYVQRPFHGRELLARIRAAIRRIWYPADIDSFTFDDITVDFRTTEVRREGRFVSIAPQEFKLLKFMTQNPERVLSRDELLREISGAQKPEPSRIVDNLILRLRQKLERFPARPLYFRTVQRFGYKFVP